MSEDNNIQELLDKAAQDLSEHVDSVQIFCTLHQGDATVTAAYDSGSGNIFARIGQIKDWVIRQDQFTKTHADIRQRDVDDKEEQ